MYLSIISCLAAVKQRINLGGGGDRKLNWWIIEEKTNVYWWKIIEKIMLLCGFS